MNGATRSRTVAVSAAVVVSAALVALCWWAVSLAGPLNYDGAYALLWGSQIADGHRPEFQLPLAPTPKPLLIALATLLDGLGTGHRAETILLALSVGSLGWLAAAAGAVAGRLAGWPAAVLAAAIIVTREPVVSWALRGYSEVLFCALLVTALVLELRQRRAGVVALALLSVAGLLRPEAWLLSIAYLAWCWPDLRSGARVAAVMLASAAPLLWAGFDLLVTGDPSWSLTGTRQTARTLVRPTGIDALVLIAPRRIGEILREPVLAAAAAGIALLVHRRVHGRHALLAAICAVTLAFAALAVAGLPVIARYLLPVAVLLAVVAAAGMVGLLQRRGPLALRIAGVALAAWLALTAPAQLQRVTSTVAVLSTQRQITTELHALADSGRLTGTCPPLSLPNHRPVPSIAWWTTTSPFALRTDTHGPALTGTVLLAKPDARRLYVLDPRDPVKAASQLPAGFAVRSSGRYWTVAQRCHLAPADARPSRDHRR